MLAALENGVKGGKWFALIDKVYAPATLRGAWQQVCRNRGAAGVDEVSVSRFGAGAEGYLRELSEALRADAHEIEGVRRVHIPKG
jgi:RNA-directed DNA polymerase